MGSLWGEQHDSLGASVLIPNPAVWMKGRRQSDGETLVSLCRPHTGGPVPSLSSSSGLPALLRPALPQSLVSCSWPPGTGPFPDPFVPSPGSRGAQL